MRTLSVKLTKNFENISKHADKSRFFSELHSPLEIKTTRIINFKLFSLSLSCCFFIVKTLSYLSEKLLFCIRITI